MVINKYLLFGSISFFSFVYPIRATEVDSVRIGGVLLSVQRDEPNSNTLGAKVINLNSNEQLTLSFDILGTDQPNLYYRIIPQEYDWTPSSESSMFSIQGFDSYPLPYPTVSNNSVQRYNHYTISFPNEQTIFKRSGNYKLEIFDPSTAQEQTILSVPILIVDPQVEIFAQKTPNTWIDRMQKHQQINIEIQPRDRINSLGREYYVVVLQNGRWDNAVYLREKTNGTRQGDRILFSNEQGVIFPAGNEYHKLEHLDSSGLGMGISYSQSDTDYGKLSVVYPFDVRKNWIYRDEPDHDGAVIYRSNTTEKVNESLEYHLVYFVLSSPEMKSGKIIIDGEAFRYLPISERTMQYNHNKQVYEAWIPLKTGYQEFQYLYQPNGETKMRTSETEGDHYQTTNTYTILVYQKDIRSWRSELVGVLTI